MIETENKKTKKRKIVKIVAESERYAYIKKRNPRFK